MAVSNLFAGQVCTHCPGQVVLGVCRRRQATLSVQRLAGPAALHGCSVAGLHLHQVVMGHAQVDGWYVLHVSLWHGRKVGSTRLTQGRFGASVLGLESAY